MLEGEREKTSNATTSLEEYESSPVLTESNKKRVLLGAILGGVIILGLLIAIIVLVASIDTHYEPPKPKPKPIIHSFNPFRTEIVHMESNSKMTANIINCRTEIEGNQTAKLGRDIIIKNTTENPEPVRIQVTFDQIDEHLLNVQYNDPEWPRWIVPPPERDADPYERVSKQIRAHLGAHVLNHPNNTFEWHFFGRSVDMFPILTTADCRLQYFDKYVEFEARVQTDAIYGMGERINSFILKNDNYSLWNKDTTYEFGSDSETGTYGSHPFFLNRLQDKKDFIGIFMRNSNAMLFSMWRALNNGTYINYKMIGGIIDLYVIHEADADYILKKYHSLIGRPYLPPVWGMGLQQARKGYTLDKMKEVVKKYQEFYLPLDGIWADTDINQNGKAFTVDSSKFNGIKEFVNDLHKANISFVPIANPGIKKEVGYKYYDDAIQKNCLIMSAARHEQAFEGRTLAGTTVWLDFFVYDATLVWATGIHDYRELTELDGIWISENEVSQMCDGECASSMTQADTEDQIPNPFHNSSEFDYIQYRPTLDPLERNTIAMSAYHQGDVFFHKEYFVHNLFGLHIAKATFNSLFAIFEDKRFLVVSRSTWPGSGKYASHWLGENYATWDSMIGSISGMLNFNLFGIPHVGASIGGYYGNAEPELLARWYELGCFYPLMLSYTGQNANNKEPYADESIRGYIKNALVERYGLIRFMYTKIFEAFLWGGAVVHPLFFEFPEDETTYAQSVVDRTFMWGKTLYIIPALIKGQTRTRAYLPNWRWYDLRTFEMVVDHHESSVGDYFVFDQPLGHITVLIKGGTIFPYQMSIREEKVMNTEDLKRITALIVVAPDHHGKAYGTMVVDAEGIRPHPDPQSQTYRHYAFTYMQQIFRINKLAGFDFHAESKVDYFWEIIILDVFGQHSIDFVCMIDTNMYKKELQFWHSRDSAALIIHDLQYRNIPMYNLEAIVWGSVEQHDFCKFEVHPTQVSYPDDKTMIAELVTRDPESYQVKLDMKAMLLTNKIISLQIIKNDMDKARWIVPDVIDENIRKTSIATKGIADSGFKMGPEFEPFYFEVSDPIDSHDFVFTSRNLPFIYLNNFIYMKFMVNSRHIFGLGERVHKFELADGVYTLFNFDQVARETGYPPGNNMYGSHPFYLLHLHNPHEFAGVFFLNSNPMDVRIAHVGMQTIVEHMFSGGVVDAFFINRGSVDEVVKSYQYLVGRPEPLPYWAFGYHQSRWGYRDIEHLKDVVRKFDEFSIPLDAVWMDKDYMDHFKTFTVDRTRWYGIDKFVQELHTKGRHFVAIVDPGIAIDENYQVYKDGLDRGVYIRSDTTHTPLVGVTWPGYSVWIDFLHPSAEAFWEEQLQLFYEKVPFDGLWLDMNEPSNFCDGECPDGSHYIYYNFPLDYYDDLFYNPGHRPLEKGTISMEALHYGDPSLASEFNYHNLYGFMQARTTAAFFRSRLRKRPFIISSSTFPGIGRYASHWLGDNHSSWTMMEESISGMFNFQLFGIPFVGADICGYDGNSTISLCSRWMQLGAFYPFMRNHNSPNGHPQEPYVDPKLAEISRIAIHTRYSLARYFYSDYMHVVLEGGIVIRPLMFDFPADSYTYKILDEVFMFGYAIRVTPVMSDSVGSITSYFPNHDWYELGTNKKVVSFNSSAKFGQNITMACGLDTGKLNLHIKSGSIFAYQPEALETNPSTITKMLEIPITLMVVPNHNLMAKGYLFFDDDESLSIMEKNFQDLHVNMNNSEIKFVMEAGNKNYQYKHKDNVISKIVILGAREFANTQCVKLTEVDKNTRQLAHSYNNEILTLSPQEGYVILPHKIDNIAWFNSTC